MGVQIFSKQIIQKEVEDNTDRVVGFVPLPTGAKLNNCWIDMRIIGDASRAVKEAGFYGVKGMVIAVDDPDAIITLDTLWDNQVSKDLSTSGSPGTVDLDETSSSTEPEWEPGFVDLEELMGTGNVGANLEIFRREKMITFAESPVGYNASNGTYIPVDFFRTHIKGGPRVDAMSMALLGFSSPAMDNRDTNEATLPGEQQWFVYQFLDTYLEDMFKALVGINPSGASYLATATTVMEFLEHATFEPDDDQLVSNHWQVYSKVTWDVTMPGMEKITTLATE